VHLRKNSMSKPAAPTTAAPAEKEFAGAGSEATGLACVPLELSDGLVVMWKTAPFSFVS
jgi:hypothetical protein